MRDKSKPRITFDLSSELDSNLEILSAGLEVNKSVLLRGLIKFAYRWWIKKEKLYLLSENGEKTEVKWFFDID